MVGLSRIGWEALAAGQRIPSTTSGYAPLTRWKECKNNNTIAVKNSVLFVRYL